VRLPQTWDRRRRPRVDRFSTITTRIIGRECLELNARAADFGDFEMHGCDWCREEAGLRRRAAGLALESGIVSDSVADCAVGGRREAGTVRKEREPRRDFVGEHSYLVRYGLMANVARFHAESDVSDVALERGDLVVIVTQRGTELGEVLARQDGCDKPRQPNEFGRRKRGSFVEPLARK
jgi:hypothetical protein